MTNKIQYAVFEKVPAHSNKPDSVILGPYNTKEEAQGDRVKYGYDTDNYYVDVYDSDVEKYINDLINKTKKIPYNNELHGDYNVKFSLI
jgi:hypothetical protein